MILDFQNNGAVVLTTPEPGAFLNFRWESGDGSISIDANAVSDISTGILWINGLDISQEASIYGDPSVNTELVLGSSGDPSIASFYLYTRELGPFNLNLSFTVSGHPSISTIDISVLNRPYIVNSENINIFETSNVQVEGETSYLVLRSNPKFSGNIKLMVDSSNLMYLDTFKVSDILNNKKYRKQKISGGSIFSSDIRGVFSDMPLGEIYKVGEEDTLDIAIPKTNLYDQYNLNYAYGARLLLDELYNEDYSVLAPLWINSKPPDYFAVFRMPGVYNPETYIEEGKEEDLSQLAIKYLENGELVKSWGMKETTPLGIYLRNHLEELLTVRSPLFLSLSDPAQKDPDPNTWYGIAIDKGIITGRSETPYFFDQKEIFTDLNAFISEGYERLNLLCPNIINMEYAFSDNDVSLYSMSRYFGLYLTENELYEISYYAENPNSDISILSLDGKDSSSFFNSSIFDSTGNIINEYKNRIFTLNDIQKIKRFSNVEEIDGSDRENIKEWLNKPGDNLFSAKVESKTSNKFLTFKIANVLSQGEHLRIVDKTDFKIWEAYGVNSELLDKGEYWTYASTFSNSGYPTVYRTMFSVKGDKRDQIKAIKGAFDVFQNYTNTPFDTTIIKEAEVKLSFEIKDMANSNDLYFQRLTSQTTDYVYNPSTGIYDSSSAFNTASDYNDIGFYGVLSPSIEDFERLKFDSSYGPINFEIFGDRMSIMLNFMDTGDNYLYSFDSSLRDSFETYTMYMGLDNWYRLIKEFDINTAISHSYSYVDDPHEFLNRSIINTSNEVLTVEGKWNAYSTYPLIISLMGINPVKDFDFTVYDTSLGFESEYWYARGDDLDTYKFAIDVDNSLYITNINAFEIISGSGTIEINGNSDTFSSASTVNPFYFNTFDGSAYIKSNGAEVVVTYNQIDGSFNYTSYDPSISEESIENYYSSLSKKHLKYGLTVPYVTKWEGLGQDSRGNPLRLILDASIFKDVSSNFIPYGDNFQGEIGYPSFKYLDRGERAWEDYVYFDINDTLVYLDDGNTSYTTIKDMMFEEPYVDIFSKLVYSNYNINKTKLRSSIVYYNDYKRSIDGLLKGISLSFKIDDNAKNSLDVQDWDRFRISLVTIPSRNRNNNYPIEIFINENTETILMIWYQGADNLNYNKRFSSYFGGKGVIDSDSGSIFEFRSFRTGDPFWSFIKSPFVVNNASLSSDFVNIYGTQSTYDSSIASPYAQLNWNFGDEIYSIFNAYGTNFPLSNSFQFLDRQYNTFKQYVDYDYIKDSATYGNGVMNYGYTYINNANIYKDNVSDLDTLKELLSLNNIGYYIFRDDTVYSNNNFQVPPIIININDPRNYKGLYTYNGWYRPKFNNILDFNYNEDSGIIDITEKDFTFSNTNFKEYSDISQYWYNKVVNDVTSEDVSIGNAIGYWDEYNVFRSQWDGKYYIRRGSYVDGFNSTEELPSYFGSKLLKLPDSLELDNWDTVTTDLTEGKNWHILEFNLTRKIVNMFKSISDFTDNWSELTISDNVIDGYIKKTILEYYNISKPKIKVDIWTKDYAGDRLAYTLDSEFSKNTQANVDANLVYENSEYLYRIKVPVLPDLSYFIRFTLFER